MAMSDNQAAFSGWAKVEVMGHQSHVGFVTTEAYGQAVMFRIDRPGIPECEEELTVTQWVGDQYCRPGSIVKRDAVEPLSVLVGSGSIYRIIPCDEATALKAVRLETRRPLSLVKLVGAALLESGGTDDGAGDDGDEERGAEF